MYVRQMITNKVLLCFAAGSLHHAVTACACGLADHTMRRRRRRKLAAAYIVYALCVQYSLGKRPRCPKGTSRSVKWAGDRLKCALHACLRM
jgi:hypothetical protein